MRRLLKYAKYIFCGLVLAALIFQSFCVFYISNTYAMNQKNKNKPIFGNENGLTPASYFADVYYPELSEIENIMSANPPADNEESPDGSASHVEPSDGSPGNQVDEPEEKPEQSQGETAPETTHEVIHENGDTAVELEPENARTFEEYTDYEEPETLEMTDGSDGSYTEIDLLYSILITMKINQQIMIFVLAVAFIIIVFKPIGSVIIDEPFNGT